MKRYEEEKEVEEEVLVVEKPKSQGQEIALAGGVAILFGMITVVFSILLMCKATNKNKESIIHDRD